MNEPDRDRDLMARAASGDRAAFTELMDRHEDMVFAVAMRMMRDREAALDATQETFLTLFRKADRYSGEAAVSTWLYRVATNTCLDLAPEEQKRRRSRGTSRPPRRTRSERRRTLFRRRDAT
jgi:RNA polymerase sigma-70 factor, ECF subfamily